MAKYIALVAALVIALSLLQPARADSGQYPTPTPTPTAAVGGGPQTLHMLYLPIIQTPDDGVGGQGRYWGGQQAVSWCPTCNPAAS